MRSYTRFVLFAVVSQAIFLSGCGPSSSSNEAIAPSSFAPPPTKKRGKATPTSEREKQGSLSEAATQDAP